MLAGPCGESRDPRLYSAGVLTHLFSRLFLGYQAPVQVFPGSQLHGQRLRASANLPGRGGVASSLCRLAMCFSLQGGPQEKPFPVFGSQWAVPSLLYWDSSSRHAREGSQYTAPPPPPMLRHHNTTTHALILLVSFIRCQDCFKKFPWPQFKQEYSWDVLDFRQSALNLR